MCPNRVLLAVQSRNQSTSRLLLAPRGNPQRSLFGFTKQFQRDCLKKYRNKGIAYALVHEKELPYQPHRRRMAVSQAPPPNPEKARAPKNPQLPRDPKRYFLRLEERLPMAAFAL